MSRFGQEQFERLSHAWPELSVSAAFKRVPEDFVVDESLPFALTGSGEHAWLKIRKRDANTDWVAARLADFAGVRKHAVGYAGLKDRFAVTTQWFSVYLPGRDDIDWARLEIEGVEVVEATRHQKKLQRGALQHNRFTIRLRELEFDGHADFGQLLQRCALVGQQGVPNYFGEQRFGRAMSNLADAEALFSNSRKRISRHKRGLMYSAARSWMFNLMLSERVRQGSWNRYIKGDVLMLDGRSACFADDGSDELERRIASGEIHPTGVLWGDGENMASQDCLAIESAVVEQYPLFRQGLIDAGVKKQRRPLRLPVRSFEYHRDDSDLLLTFSLQTGSFATMVLRELVRLRKN